MVNAYRVLAEGVFLKLRFELTGSPDDFATPGYFSTNLVGRFLCCLQPMLIGHF